MYESDLEVTGFCLINEDVINQLVSLVEKQSKEKYGKYKEKYGI